jgi:beta-lactamase class A
VRIASFLVFGQCLCVGAVAQPHSHPAIPGDSRADRLKAEIKRIAAVPGMQVGAAVWHLPASGATAEKVELDGDTPYPLASVFKLPLMLELVRQIQEGGKLTLASQITLTNSEKCVGGGTLKDQPAGTRVSVERLIELMETISDNTATDILFRRIGLESVDRLLKQLGCEHSEIQLTNRAAWLLSLAACHQFRGMSPSELVESWKNLSTRERLAAARAAETENCNLSLSAFQHLEDASSSKNTPDDDILIATGMDNMASPDDLAHVLAQLDPNRKGIAILQPRWRKFCLGVLSRQHYNTRIPRGLPAGVKVYHKTGTIAGVVNDAGLVELPDHSMLAVVVLVQQVHSDQGGQADRLIAAITRAAYAAYK